MHIGRHYYSLIRKSEIYSSRFAIEPLVELYWDVSFILQEIYNAWTKLETAEKSLKDSLMLRFQRYHYLIFNSY